MAKTLFQVPFLSAIGMIITYKCPVSCKHCLLKCGPYRREEISLDNARDWISQAALYRDGRVRMISLTGGEPFFNHQHLKAIASHAKDSGLLVTAVTNAFWADTKENARTVLGDLDDLTALAISADEHHQARIPYQNIENAIDAVQSAGMPCIINICTGSLEDPYYRTLRKRLEVRVDPACIRTVITFPFGRAAQTRKDCPVCTSPPRSACGSCDAPVIFPNGRVIACLGPVVEIAGDHPLVLGNLQERPLAEIFDAANQNALLHALRLWGPKKLVASLERAGLSEHLPGEYVRESICPTCYHLMSSPKTAKFLTALNQDPEFSRLVSYGRRYFLEEDETWPNMARNAGDAPV